MTLRHRLVSVLRWLVHRNRAEQDLHDEVQAFVDMAAADKMRDGVVSNEARRLAILDLGGIEQTKERVRSYRHGALLDDVGRDVRYAFRIFAKHPGFTFVVVLTLALGIGANTAIFSLIDALMLRWLPVRNPQELVQPNSGPQMRVGLPPRASRIRLSARSQNRPTSSPAWPGSARSSSMSARPAPSPEFPARS